MGDTTDSIQKPLTGQQEKFAQAVAQGMNYTTAYRLAYDASGMLPATANNEGYKLAHDPEITTRIEFLKVTAAASVTSGIAWTTERLIKETETNIEGSRADGNWPAANGAVQIAGKASGLLTEKVEHSGVVEHKHSLSLEQLQDRNNQLLAALGEPEVVEGTGGVVDDEKTASATAGDNE